ncbi:MAG: arsenic transporter [Alphaproteobacteria bacterium]|nr:arsenic transporter [Alphaproteobacteria bacterium]
MGAVAVQPWTVWGIAAAATAGIIIRPFSWPEAVWAVLGAGLLVVLGLLPWPDALAGIVEGTDVYLFLGGMMVLAELARQEGLFDWLAAKAARAAKGSAPRLFALVFGVGTIVTTFLSNDATAVVLTPAVAAVVKAAHAEEPLPYLLVCAFVANAASFVLPISNPANLVVYGSHVPPLLEWLPRYALPSLLSIGATYGVLRWTQRRRLAAPVATDIPVPKLSASGRTTACGLAAAAAALMAASACKIQLGLPTFLAGLATAGLVLTRSRCGLAAMLRNVSWGVLPLVAGLFVLVEGLRRTGLLRMLSELLHDLGQRSAAGTGWGAGVGVALACNLMNNLPAGLIAGGAVRSAEVPAGVTGAVLIGIDLGPNLSVTGSLATILWLSVLRREGQKVSGWSFLKLGLLIMPPALLLAVGAMLLVG